MELKTLNADAKNKLQKMLEERIDKFSQTLSNNIPQNKIDELDKKIKLKYAKELKELNDALLKVSELEKKLDKIAEVDLRKPSYGDKTYELRASRYHHAEYKKFDDELARKRETLGGMKLKLFAQVNSIDKQDLSKLIDWLESELKAI